MSSISSSTVYQYISGKLVPTEKCIAFDMDDTLISGGYTNLYTYPGAVEKIQKLHDSGYTIIVISNQKLPRMNNTMVNAKIQFVAKCYKIPIHFFCARADDEFRKPNIGILGLVPTSYGKLEIFVGDAAGRPGDHSDCDKMFSKNAGLEFFTPEEYFNDFPVIDRINIPPTLKPGSINYVTMVMLVGICASGKSTYARQVLPTFYHINRDELKQTEKCLKVCRKLLGQNQSVVIDNMNSTKADRARYISIARDEGAAVVVIHFRTTIGQAALWNKERDRVVPQIVFYKFRKDFELPDMNEGIDEIYSII